MAISRFGELPADKSGRPGNEDGLRQFSHDRRCSVLKICLGLGLGTLLSSL